MPRFRLLGLMVMWLSGAMAGAGGALYGTDRAAGLLLLALAIPAAVIGTLAVAKRRRRNTDYRR